MSKERTPGDLLADFIRMRDEITGDTFMDRMCRNSIECIIQDLSRGPDPHP